MDNRDLIDYWPDEVQKIIEFQAIAAVENPETSRLWNEIERILADQFISTATERGLSRWERIFKITPKGDASTDERRFAILTKITERLPYTFRMLKFILTELCGVEDFKLCLNDAYTLKVGIGLSSYHMFNDIVSMLRRVVPANMVIIVAVEYNRHSKFKTFKHSELAEYTHYQIRTEVNI